VYKVGLSTVDQEDGCKIYCCCRLHVYNNTTQLFTLYIRLYTTARVRIADETQRVICTLYKGVDTAVTTRQATVATVDGGEVNGLRQ